MNKVYTNYISGSVSQVSGCLEIILFNKFSFSEKISLYNLEDFYLKNLVGTSENYVKLRRENSEVVFEYKKSLSSGFNVILYISSVSGSPIGYTEFINTQGLGVSLGIRIDISRTLVNNFTIILENGLIGNDLTKNYKGKELYNYATRDDIIRRKYRNLFTSDIGRLESDVYSFIVGSSGLVTKESTWKLGIKKNVIIASNFEDSNICFYKGNLVLACWGQRNFSLYPLIGNTGLSGTVPTKIERIEGRYYKDTTGILRDLDTGYEVTKQNDTLFCDYLNPKCTVYDLPVFYSSSDIFKYIPEINNIYLDLNYYLESNQVRIHSKIGSWFIMSREYGGTTLFIAVSPTTIINMTEEDLGKSIFVGDQTLILCESDYYSVFNSFGTVLSTERARVILEGGRLDEWTILNDPEDSADDKKFLFCYLDTNEDEEHFEEYYGDGGLVHLVFKNEELGNTVFNKYRRNVYPESEGIPELMGSFGGIIFYKVGNKINYL